MKKQPRRNIGKLGSYVITATQDGHSVKQDEVVVPKTKDEAEAFFAPLFVEEHNRTLPLGRDYRITLGRQNDTADRDFNILSIRANKLELAELTPLSHDFGQAAKKNGRLDVYEYAQWIYQQIVAAKEQRYRKNGVAVERVILTLYVTHMQFLLSENVLNCLRRLCIEGGCSFDAVFAFATNGSDLKIVNLIHPYPLANLPRSSAYKGLTLINLTLEEGDHGDAVSAIVQPGRPDSAL
jgi:hypothetical protein